jgi:hypothetical protein
VAPEDLLEEIPIPGVPDTAEEREDYGGWTAGAVRAGVEAIASATDEDTEELLDVATDSARRDIIGMEQAAEQVERDLERMSRERLLPDEKPLEKVARYEAHLSRLSFKALHELEALQVRRSGGAAPLARLDVDGLVAGLRPLRARSTSSAELRLNGVLKKFSAAPLLGDDPRYGALRRSSRRRSPRARLTGRATATRAHALR